MILVLDTATSTPVIALAAADGSVVAERPWQSHHRHGEELLQRLDELLAEAGTTRRDLTGVVVGTGPGSFTGLRIGLATAKTIAYTLNLPLVGISSTLAIAAAAAAGTDVDIVNVTLPAGASDRYTHRFKIKDGTPRESGPPKLVAGEAVAAEHVAIDLDAAPAAARERGERALNGLAAALAGIGAQRMAAGKTDDVAELVPAYVALPRGLAKAAVEMEWSPDLR